MVGGRGIEMTTPYTLTRAFGLFGMTIVSQGRVGSSNVEGDFDFIDDATDIVSISALRDNRTIEAAIIIQ